MTMLKNHNDNDDNRTNHKNGNNRDNCENRVNGDNCDKRDIVGHTFFSFSAVLHCQLSQVFLSLLVVASSGIRTYVDLFYKILL